jgi:hypothetical protein
MDSLQNVTTVNPIGLVMLLALGFWMVTAKKEWALVPMIVLACFIPPGQRLVVASLDFNFLRLMVIFGCTRIILRNEHLSYKPHPADRLMIAWAAVKTVLYTVQMKTPSAFVYMLGSSFEVLGFYFIARLLLGSLDDVRNMIKTIAIVSFPIAFFFFFEKQTGRNVFSVFGGVSAFTEIREGRLRAQGAFAHPILAGSFFASLLPMIIAMVRKEKKFQPLMIACMVPIAVIIFGCASSTPLIGVMLAFAGMAFFPLRFNMRPIQLLALAGYATISLTMKMPPWHLISRIDLAGGSTGYYRYMLIDMAVRHFKEWYLIGGVESIRTWRAGDMVYNDVVNQYILEGLFGGITAIILFLAVIVACFAGIGRLVKSRRLSGDDERLVWALGTSLFTHAFMFLVVSYFGQIVMLWNLLLAIIISMCVIYSPSSPLSRNGESLVKP